MSRILIALGLILEVIGLVWRGSNGSGWGAFLAMSSSSTRKFVFYFSFATGLLINRG